MLLNCGRWMDRHGSRVPGEVRTDHVEHLSGASPGSTDHDAPRVAQRDHRTEYPDNSPSQGHRKRGVLFGGGHQHFQVDVCGARVAQPQLSEHISESNRPPLRPRPW